MTELFSTALLIEDEPAHAELIKRALKSYVGNIIHAPTGEDGIRELGEHYVDLVLCDLNLPDMTALDILAQVHEARPGLAFIVLTSSSDLESAVKAMRGGASDYMVKSFSSDFKGRLELMLNRLSDEEARKIREIQLRSERDAFWTAAHSTTDGLAILTSRGEIVFENRAFCLLRKVISETDHPENIVSLTRKLSASVADAIEEQLKGVGQNALWLGELAVPVMVQDKLVTRYFELNLSANRLPLDSISLEAEQLDEFRRVILWTKDITAKKDQERMNRDLLATTTHDLKGPLGAIINSCELIDSMLPEAEPKVGELLNRVSSSSRNCINLIDELLSARRIQDGVFVVKPKLLDLADELHEVVLDYLPMAKNKNLSLSDKPAGDIKIYADAIAFRRVLGNLINNAIKFTPSGGSIELASEYDEQEVRVSCADTGLGVDANLQHTLFEKYGRLDRDQSIDGTGLGLFVTKNIVDAHGGRIEVKSTGGKGTTFILSFPHKE